MYVERETAMNSKRLCRMFLMGLILTTMLMVPAGSALAAPSGYRLPFDGTYIITSGPGCSSTHVGTSSEAIDYALPTSTAVKATEAGTVIYSADGWNDGFGTLIKVQHSG